MYSFSSIIRPPDCYLDNVQGDSKSNNATYLELCAPGHQETKHIKLQQSQVWPKGGGQYSGRILSIFQSHVKHNLYTTHINVAG
jgi:hypothetical protein